MLDTRIETLNTKKILVAVIVVVIGLYLALAIGIAKRVCSDIDEGFSATVSNDTRHKRSVAL